MSDTVDFNIETPDTIDFDLTVGDVTVSQDHRELTHRDAVNQHPINAISGLQAALDGKQATIPSNTYDAYGAASSAVTTHNSSAQAHNSLFNDKQDKLPTPVNNYFLHANASTGALEWAAGGGGGGTGDHTQLTNRDAANQHPISAVTDLQTNLDKKVMGYIEYGTPTTILDTTTLNFTAGTSYATGLYQSAQNVFQDLTLAHLYRITWDGVDYDCLWFQGVMSGTADSRLGSVTNTWGVNMLGHVSDINGIYNEYENDSCPFSFTKNWARNSGRYIWTKDTSATHTIKIVDLNIVIHKGLKNIYLPSPYSRKTNENGFISLLTSSKYIGSVSAIGVAKNTGQHAAAFGLGTTVTGNQAFAEGICCIASGESSHAEGGSCTASGQYAHAEGSGNVASAYATHVSGSSNSVTADGAYAEGTNNTSSGYYAHAEGGWNTASGWGAHVEGYDNTASSTMSHVEGESNTASGYNTHVEGFGNNAKKELNHVQGMYAVDDSGSQSWGEETVGNYLDIIGNGTASNARSNAYALGWDGTGHYKGDLYTGCNADSTGGNKVATETWVGQQGYLTQHQSLAAYRTSAAQDAIDATKANVTELDAVEEKIPAQATSSNKLADKDFVNSSIATNTANYISNSGQPFTSVAQLEAYSGTVTNNDYAFVTGTDEHGNTYFDRYKATVSGSTITWAKEYRLNNSSFTAAQWAAISSNVTSGKVSTYDGYATQIANKQDAEEGYDVIIGIIAATNSSTSEELKAKLEILRRPIGTNVTYFWQYNSGVNNIWKNCTETVGIDGEIYIRTWGYMRTYRYRCTVTVDDTVYVSNTVNGILAADTAQQGQDNTFTAANTFTGTTIVPTPTANTHAATKAYVDSYHDDTKLSTAHASAADAHSSLFSAKEDASNKVTSVSSASTDTQYASAKCVYDLVGNIEALLEALL